MTRSTLALLATAALTVPAAASTAAPPRAPDSRRDAVVDRLHGVAFGQTGARDGGSAPRGPRPITEMDLFRFQWVADPQISADGETVAFVHVAVDAKREGYDTAIHVVAADGRSAPRRFTSGPRDTTPRLSPDGRWLAFLRAVEKDGRVQPPQLHLMPLAGGEARAVTDLPRGVAGPEWAPDSRALAFTGTAHDGDLGARKAGSKGGERESDVRVITRAVYRNNASGYADPTRPAHLWIVELGADGSAGEPRRLTSGEFAAQNPAWAGDGSRIFYTSIRVKEPYHEPPRTDLLSVTRAGEATTLGAFAGTVGALVASPDGSRLAFRGTPNGSPVRSYSQPELYVVDTAGKAAPRNVTEAWDFDFEAGLTGDQRAPRAGGGSTPVWSADGRSVIGVGAEHGRANLLRFDVESGRVEPVTRGDHEVVSYAGTPDANRFVVLVSTPTVIGDLHALDPATGLLSRLTSFNDALFAELRLTEPEEVWYRGFDGRRLHTLVQRPPDFDPGKGHPLILNVHGGPHAAYGYTFDHEFQWMAAKGYVVVYPNPRGSTSYGQEFGNLIQHRYPGDDHEDLMGAVDAVIARGGIDVKKLGITGGSGGGVLTNWAITRTDRFAAAVSQRSIADWTSFWYTADFTLFQPTWFKAAPFEDPKDFAARSAITHVAKVKTPLMLIEGEADLRTPPGAGGEMMFRALKYRKVPTVMVRFPGESHELSRSGQPWHRVERLQHLVGWFDHWLLGKENPAYAP